MSELVKTMLLKAVESLFNNNLPGIMTVCRDWLFPFDLGATDENGSLRTPLPALFFYEDPEDLGTLGSRVAKNIVFLDLAIFDAFSEPVYTENSPAWQTFKDWADIQAAQIHSLWHNRTHRMMLKSAGLIQLEEMGNRKAPASELYGEMVVTVRLTYGHALGDAFTMQLS